MKEVVLPVSGHKVELKEALTYGEYKAIEGVMLRAAKGSIIGGEMSQSFDASIVAEYTRRMIETFVVKSVDGHGQEVQINLMLDSLDVADGVKLEQEVHKIFAAIKKKLS